MTHRGLEFYKPGLTVYASRRVARLSGAMRQFRKTPTTDG